MLPNFMLPIVSKSLLVFKRCPKINGRVYPLLPSRNRILLYRCLFADGDGPLWNYRCQRI